MNDWLIILILAAFLAGCGIFGIVMYWIIEAFMRLSDRRFARRMVQGFDHDIAKLGMGSHDYQQEWEL